MSISFRKILKWNFKRRSTIPELRALKRQYEKHWLKIKGVQAIGIGLTDSGKVGLIVSVEKYSPELRTKIPEKVKGYPVEIRETGKIEAR